MTKKTAKLKIGAGTKPRTRSDEAKRLPVTRLSKSETIRELLTRSEGASIPELSQASGWQAHSVRGYLSGTLKKKLGLTLLISKDERGCRYRLGSETST